MVHVMFKFSGNKAHLFSRRIIWTAAKVQMGSKCSLDGNDKICTSQSCKLTNLDFDLKKFGCTVGFLIIGFTVAILGPFSAHFQLHFWIFFGCLAEE